MRKKPFLMLSILTVALAGVSASASATGLTKAWVSSAGANGSGCGPIATPCRTIAGALAILAPGGEIDIHDPGAYGPGPIVINQAVSIVNDGVGVAGVQAGSGNNAFTISVGAADTVVIRGLTIDGGGVGSNGIEFDGGGGLTVANCVIRHFANTGSNNGNGILLAPTVGTTSVLVSNAMIADNGLAGVYYDAPSGSNTLNAAFDRVIVQNNNNGLAFETAGGVAAFNASVSESIVRNNSGFGLFQDTNPSAISQVVVDSSYFLGNQTAGIQVQGQTLWLGRSVVQQNGIVGVRNLGGTINSYQDNKINGNGTDTVGTISTASNH